MLRYFFNVHDGADFPDRDGTELAGIEDAKREAVLLAGRILAENPTRFWNGEQWSLDVCDDTGLILLTLNFVATMAPAVTGGRSAM